MDAVLNHLVFEAFHIKSVDSKNLSIKKAKIVCHPLNCRFVLFVWFVVLDNIRIGFVFLIHNKWIGF